VTVMIGRNFADQARIAANDPNTSTGTVREGLRSAADILDTNATLIIAQQRIIEHQRLRCGATLAVAIMFGVLLAANLLVGWP
jgi:hypothetical protein